MKYIKKYESESGYKRTQAYTVSLYNLEDSKNYEDYVLYSQEDQANFIINYVNEEIRVAYVEEEVDDKIIEDPEEYGAIKDETNIPTFIDNDDAMEWYNENSRSLNKSSSCIINTDICEIIENVKLDKKIKELREIKKFNL